MSENIITKVMSKKISRRSFLKWTSALGATSAVGGLTLNQAAKAVAAASSVPQSTTCVDWVPSICLVCHSWCRIAVGVDASGVVRKIEGSGGQPRADAFGTGMGANGDLGAGYRNNDQDDTYNTYCRTKAGVLPYSQHNRGRICAKGNDGMEHTYDSNRITSPLIRTGKRGEGKWRRITWKQLYHGDSGISLDDGTGRKFKWHGIAKILRDMGNAAPGLDHNYSNASGNYYGDVAAVAGGATRRTHRLLMQNGRNESDNAGGKLWHHFAEGFGTPNYVEHTNLCESSRHVAQERMLKDKFPIHDTTIHGTRLITADTRLKGDGKTNYTLGAKDDVDLYVSFGGNICEASIPHATLAQRHADVRRNGGRLVSIDVRHGNTAAYADEDLYIKPGTDGALAAGIVHTIMSLYNGGTAALRARLDLRNTVAATGNNKYQGLFIANETGGGAADGVTPAGGSLETYLTAGLGADDPSPGVKNIAWALTQIGGPGGAETNIDSATIMYLAWAFSDNWGHGTAYPTGNGTIDAFLLANSLDGVEPPRNPIADGYRGPAKHSNGTYSYKLVRSLQLIACGHNDGTAATATEASELAKRSGGIDRAGGLCHDAWNAVHDGVGALIGNNGEMARTIADKRQITAQRLDNWDYYGFGGVKFALAGHKAYSNLLPGVRASIGLHPFKDGVLNTVPNTNPYGEDRCAGLENANPNGATFDHNFQIEVLLNHKSNSRFSTPGAACDGEAYEAVGSNGYRLKYLFSSDICMGDVTMFADVIIPDTSYLERYVFNWHENGAVKICMGMRQPVWQSSTGENEHLFRDLAGGYGTRPIRQTVYQWARAIEADVLDDKGDATAIGNAGGGYGPWNGDLFKNYCWDYEGANQGTLPGVPAYQSDRAWANKRYSGAAAIPAQTGNVSADAKFDYMRTNGVWESPESYTPNYWRDTSAKVMAVYDAEMETKSDPTVGTGLPGSPKEGAHRPSNGKFFGMPIYVPIRKTGGRPSDGSLVPDPANGVYNMTTYKVNVHTQARTANLPRLSEIISQNWAMFAPGSKDKFGAAINDGDTVKISAQHRTLDGTDDATIVRHGIWEAKVTPRATNPNVVSISQSFGHDIRSLGGDGFGGQGWDETTDGSGYSKNPNGPAAAGAPSYLGMPTGPSTKYDPTSRTVQPVMGVNHGTHTTWVMSRGGEDPIGGSVAWMDTIVEVEKI